MLTVVWVVKTRSIIIYSETRLGFLVIPVLLSGLVFLVIFVSWRKGLVSWSYLAYGEPVQFSGSDLVYPQLNLVREETCDCFFFPSVFSSYDFDRPRRKKRSKTFIQ